MLLFDVSASMAADDVDPSRMEAAKAAARTIVDARPPGRRHRRRRVQRRGPRRPGADQRPGRGARRRRAHGRRRGAPRWAAGSSPRSRRSTRPRATTPRRLLQQPLARSRPRRPQPVPPGSDASTVDRPVQRRREHRAAGPGRGRADRRQPRASASSPSASARPRAPPSTSTASRSRRASTRRRSSRSPTARTGPTCRRATRRGRGRVYDQLARALVVPRRGRGADRARRARSGSCCCSPASGLSLARERDACQ